MELYWLLTTHLMAIFPMYICYLNYKKYKKSKPIFVLINILINTLFSIFYHTYDYDNIKLNISSYNTWLVLDHLASSTVIFLTVLYCLRIRSNNLYLMSYSFNSILIIIYLLTGNMGSFITSYYTIFNSLAVLIFNHKLVLTYIKEFFIFSIITIISIIIATIFFYIGIYINYNLFHPLWHIFIHLSAGLACILKSKMDEKLLNINNDENITYNRTSSESI